MKSFLLGRAALLVSFSIISCSAAQGGIKGSDLVSLIQEAATKQGLHVVPQTSKIKIWPACDGKLSAQPIKTRWEAVAVECLDARGQAWNAVIRTKIVGKIRSLNSQTDSPPPKILGKPSDPVQEKRGSRYQRLVDRLNRTSHYRYKPQKYAKQSQNKTVRGLKFRIPLKANTVIRETDIYFSNIPARASELSFNNKQDVIGRKTRSHVAANLVIAPRHLHTRWDVYKGDRLTIVNSLGPIEISAGGLAMSHGQIGGRISVRNSVSGKILTGIVEKRKKVRIFSKQR